MVTSAASLVAIVLGFDEIASVALVVALLVRHLFPTRLAPISVALVAVAISLSSAEPRVTGAASAIGFALFAREYALLVCAQQFGAAGWGSRPPGTSTVVVEGALVGYLVAGRPESVLLVLAASCVLWAVVVAAANGLAIARREGRYRGDGSQLRFYVARIAAQLVWAAVAVPVVMLSEVAASLFALPLASVALRLSRRASPAPAHPPRLRRGV